MRNCTIVIIFLAVLAPSCKVLYPNLMFRQGNYQYFELEKTLIDEYIIQPGDELTLKIFSRDGFRMLDVLSSASGEQNLARKHSFLVDNEGFAELPIMGKYYVIGYTEDDLEDKLEDELSKMFTNPYALLKVANRRVFVFKGSSGHVVRLNEAPTTLLEVIARSGGISKDLKSHNIKIIRGDLNNPEIRVVDLSTIQGLRDADLIVQTNDIIYIDTRKKLASELLQEITPVLALISTILTSLVLFRTVSGGQ